VGEGQTSRKKTGLAVLAVRSGVALEIEVDATGEGGRDDERGDAR